MTHQERRELRGWIAKHVEFNPAKAIAAVAKEYGVSPSTVRRACDEHGVQREPHDGTTPAYRDQIVRTVLRLQQGESPPEIAAAESCSPKHVHRIRAALSKFSSRP